MEKTRIFAEQEKKHRIYEGHLERDVPTVCDYDKQKRLFIGKDPLLHQLQKVVDDMDE